MTEAPRALPAPEARDAAAPEVVQEPYGAVDTIMWLMPVSVLVLVACGTLIVVFFSGGATTEAGGLHPFLAATLPLVGTLCGFTLAFYFANSRLQLQAKTPDRGRVSEPLAASIMRKIDRDPDVVRGDQRSRSSLLDRLRRSENGRLIVLDPNGTFRRTVGEAELLPIEGGTTEDALDLAKLEPDRWRGGFVSPRTPASGVAHAILSDPTRRDVLVTETGESSARVVGRITDRSLLRHAFGVSPN